MTSIEIKWTPRFKDHFRRYNGISEYVVKKTAELIKRADANPDIWHFELEKLKDDSFADVAAFKVAITSGDRLVFVIQENALILTDIGNHDIMDEYSRMSRKARDEDLNLSTYIDGTFMKQLEIAKVVKGHPQEGTWSVGLGGVLQENHEGDDSRWLFEEELSSDWVNFLDNEQARISSELFEKLVSPAEEISIAFIMGGPGTGKTVVLLNLANNLFQAGRSVSFELSDQVLKYLKSGNMPVPGANLGFGPGVVALIDDPSSSKELAENIRKAKSAGCRAIVVGFDPLQWHERKMESNFKKICENNSFEIFPLVTCYRQTSGVGRKSQALTKNIFETSSRYLDSLKQAAERKELQPFMDLSLGMGFVDESGRYLVYESDIEKNYLNEIGRFRERIDRWKHTSPISFVYQDGIPADFQKTIRQNAIGLNKREILLSNYRDIRGVEFQELFLFISPNFWRQLNEGKLGVGSDEWEELACLHTILSRPKDSLVIFVGGMNH